MLPELYWIEEVNPLRLALMARPRSEDWLQEEIAGWRQAGIDTVVSLLETYEVRELGLAEERSLCVAQGMEFLTQPIPDRGAPKSVSTISRLADDLVLRLRRGAGLGIHCRAAIGRSGLVSACVLIRLGVPFEAVFPLLSRVRRTTVPDTQDQVDWVHAFSNLKQGI
jgi:protein-tyrosine phosphatase